MEKTNFGLIHLLIRSVLYPWITRVRFLSPNVDDLLALQREGQLLFVGQIASLIDFLIVNETLKRKGFQPLQFTHGLNPFLVMPFRQALRIWWERLFKKEDLRVQMELTALVARAQKGQSGLLFLKKRTEWFGPRTHFFRGFFGELTAQLKQERRKVFLVPTSVFLTRARKKNLKRTIWDILFGTYDIPGRTRKIYQLFANHQNGGTIFSKPIDFDQQLEHFHALSEQDIGKRIRWSLLFHLNREDRAYRGPNKRSRERKVRKILKEPRLNEELKAVALRTNRSLESVLKEAGKNLHEIASDTSERVVNLLRIIFDYVWARTLEGLDVPQEDLDRIRELNKAGPVVYLPCHRSHVDYLAVAYLFEKKGLQNPRIAAGDNLAKWPLGPILRRAGGFFIRRSFRGETIFPLVFDAYIRHVLRQRHILIFFMEGGRSRTGKLLHPKLGMLSMIFDAWRQGIVKELPLVPVTIDYGKVFEGQAYLREKGGQEKEREDLRSVLRSRKVLKKKHGILRVRFGEPIFLSEYVAREGQTREKLGFKAKLPFLYKLSYEVMKEISRNVTLTAGNIVAGLLMGTTRRGMTQSELRALFVLSVRHLQNRKVELAFPEKQLDVALKNAIDTFEQWDTIVRAEVSGEIVLSIQESKRSEMEYYKNNGLHFILDLSLFCMAFHCLSPGNRSIAKITEFARQVFDQLDQEFVIRDGFPNEEQMEEAFKALEVIDALSLREDRVIFGNYRIGRHLVLINAHLLLNFLESYFVVFEVLSGLEKEKEMDKKQLLKLCIAKAKLLFAVGTIRRSESINNVTFSTALDKFSDSGFLHFKKSKGNKHQKVLMNPQKSVEFHTAKDQLFDWLNRLS